MVMMLLGMVATAADYTNEQLDYQIVYQWGPVWKHAGDASLSIKKNSGGYVAQLTGKTRSWADSFYPVRDTLRCQMNSKLQPLRYDKFTHEKDYNAHDVVQFSYYYSNTSAQCTRYRKSRTEKTTLEAKCQAYDMVSVFYMLRNLDFNQLASTKRHTTVIFSGKMKEYLTINYHGLEKVKLRNGTKQQAYRLSFRFTQKGGTRSSEDIDVWISTDAQHIPLVLVGKLPIGKVKCYYTK